MKVQSLFVAATLVVAFVLAKTVPAQAGGYHADNYPGYSGPHALYSYRTPPVYSYRHYEPGAYGSYYRPHYNPEPRHEPGRQYETEPRYEAEPQYKSEPQYQPEPQYEPEARYYEEYVYIRKPRKYYKKLRKLHRRHYYRY